MTKKELKKRLFEILEPAKNTDIISKIFDIGIITLIILNIFAVILTSFETINNKMEEIFNYFEIFSIVIFSIEYLFRIYTSNFKFPYNGKIRSLIKFIFSPMALIDLLAILPFYLPFIISVDLRFLRILRLTRILRVFKINRYSKSLQLLGKVIKNKKEEFIITIFITFLLILLASSMMYFIENGIQPDAFPNIIATFWWAIATLTTVGYGDVYPITTLGKVLAGIIALLGIGLVALPTGIISSGFMEEYNNGKEMVRIKNNRSNKMKKRRLSLRRKKRTIKEG